MLASMYFGAWVGSWRFERQVRGIAYLMKCMILPGLGYLSLTSSERRSESGFAASDSAA